MLLFLCFFFAFEEQDVPLLVVFVICNIFVLIWSDSFCRISTDLLLDIQCGNTDRYRRGDVRSKSAHPDHT